MGRNFLLVIILHFLVSCAPLSKAPDYTNFLAYQSQSKDQSLLSRFHPTFIIEKPHKLYNRIGTPKADLTAKGAERIFVDPGEATVYTEQRSFKTATDTYTNLIYRIHFPRTPFGLLPFQLGLGRNVGLIVIITLDRLQQPVLYTTVHTCGCYLALIPTTYLPEKALPLRWPEISQVVYTEILPARLDPILRGKQNDRLFVLIKNASHRITDIWLASDRTLQNYVTNPITMDQMTSLEQIPLPGMEKVTSFYETSGARKGYVKGSHKPLERAFISWWAFDWNVGEDKKLGANKSDPPVFYTSLKPWARDASDMRDFPAFLRYWGWNL